MVKNCPSIDEERDNIEQIIKSAECIIGYNTQFDIAMLHYAGIDTSNETVIVDVMTDFAPIFGEWSEKYQNYKWQTLSTCAAYYNYDWGGDSAHNSLADCRATLFCYKKMEDICRITPKTENFADMLTAE